jgi:exodeoxyribonuclease VII small subunit
MLRQGSVAACASLKIRGSSSMTEKKAINLEKSLADLEALVDELENGDLPLDKAMKKFEEGIKLTRGCQAALRDAEQKVEILLKSTGGEEALRPFEAGD